MAGPSGAPLQVLQEAQQAMGLEEELSEPATGDRIRKSAARCWAMLLARIYEFLPLQCPKCGTIRNRLQAGEEMGGWNYYSQGT
jgi:hypothetical protein